MFQPDGSRAGEGGLREHCLATGEPYHIEYRLRHRSNEYRWVLGRAQPVRDKLGRITRWYGTCTDIHDLKTTQVALIDSEARFRTLIDVSPQVVWFGDAEGAITYCNAYWYDYTGLAPGDTSGDGWVSVIHSDYRERVLGVWKHAAQSAEAYEIEIPFRRASDGAYRWFIARGQPIRNADGCVERWVGIALDIHERKQAEEASARLAAIVSSSTDAIISFEPESGRIQTWNEGAEALFGYTPAEAIGGPVDLLVPGEGLTTSENQTGVFDLVKTYGKAEIESIRRCKDGRLLDVSITATWVTAPDGRSLGVAGIFRDITARRRTERALAAERARLDAIFKTVPVGIVIAEAPSGRILDGNPQVERIFRHPVLPSPDMASYKAWIAFHPDGRQVEGHEYPLSRALTLGETTAGDEYLYQRGDGTHAWVRITGAPIRDAEGQITGGVVAIVDIDEEKRAEEAARQSEARFRKLIEASPVGIAIGDLEGGYSYGNPAMQHLLGYSADEFAQGQVPWRGITPPEWAHKDDEAVRQLKTHGVSEQFEKEYIAKDGHRVPILIGGAMVERVGEGGEDVAAYVVDLTALKQAEADLRDREALLSSIFQSAGLYTGVVELLDDDVLYVMANERSAEFFGRNVAEMQGMRLSELGTSPEAVAHWLAFMRECYVKSEPTVLEYPFEKSGEIRHYLGTYTPLPTGQSKRPRLALVSLDISERKRLEEQQALVTRELHHRVKNTLAIVQALVSSTARHATTIAEFQQSITDRIVSLAKTHTLLINDQWGGATLKDILLAELSPYEDEIGQRVRLEGPDLHLPSEIALAVSMAAHELTTNAAKYGAFSLPNGRVHVAWTLERTEGGERLLTLAWDEHDGPLVQEPTRKGFGSVLLQRVLGRQLGGQVEVTYAEEGVRVRLTALLPQTQ